MPKAIVLIFLFFLDAEICFSQNVMQPDTVKASVSDTSKMVIIPNIEKKIHDTTTLSINTNKNHSFHLTEWEKGFISGLIATLLGFVLTMLWDIFKNYRDNKRKDKIINKLIRDVLNENITYIQSINYVLTEELKILNQRQFIVTNITILKNDFWEIIKFNIPKDLLKENNLLKRLQDISSLTKSINENINSREIYRLNNNAMTNFSANMQHYDELIIQENTKLNELIISFNLDYKE